MPPAGWYDDPAGSGSERFWDGAGWSQATRPRPEPELTPESSLSSEAPKRIAPWTWRALAFFLDRLLLMFVLSPIRQVVLGDALERYNEWLRSTLVGYLRPLSPEIYEPLLLSAGLMLVAGILYRFISVPILGGTLGQKLCLMQVIREGDQSLARLSWGRSLARAMTAELYFVMPIVQVLNALWPLGNLRRQALHDFTVGTLVVQKSL